MKTPGLYATAIAAFMVLSLTAPSHAATYVYAGYPGQAFSATLQGAQNSLRFATPNILPANLTDTTDALFAPLYSTPMNNWVSIGPFAIDYQGFGNAAAIRSLSQQEGLFPELLVWTLLIGSFGIVGFTLRLRRLASRVWEMIED